MGLPIGVFSLVDEESLFRNGTGMVFYIDRQLIGNARLAIKISIRHVSYDRIESNLHCHCSNILRLVIQP